jgi:hypothetical protein
MDITPNLFLSACAGKVVFDTYSHARRSMRKTDRGVQPYHCRVCGKWHMGSNTNTRGRKLQRKIFNQKKEQTHD